MNGVHETARASLAPILSASVPAGAEDISPSASPSPPPAVLHARGETLGEITIPRINVLVSWVEGSSDEELLLGAGHVTGSAYPGEGGHSVIAGHRVTRRMHPFRYLHLLEAGDDISIVYRKHRYIYEVSEQLIVKADETWVLEPFDTEHETLTLITCHPPGSLRKRIIVRAYLQDVVLEPPTFQ